MLKFELGTAVQKTVPGSRRVAAICLFFDKRGLETEKVLAFLSGIVVRKTSAGEGELCYLILLSAIFCAVRCRFLQRSILSVGISLHDRRQALVVSYTGNSQP